MPALLAARARHPFVVCVLLLGAVSLDPAGAVTRTVCASGCAHTTVQAAVDAATGGDLILLSDAYHTEADIVVGKNVEIAGAPGPRPVLQAAAAPGVAGLRVLHVLANSVVTIRDLVLRHGQDLAGWGGAIRNEGMLTLRRVDLVDNESVVYGGAVGSYGPLVIEDSFIARNEALDGGGVLCLDTCPQLEIRRTLFEANALSGGGYGAGVFTTAPTVVEDSELRGNVGASAGGGIRHTENLVVVRTDFFDNAAGSGGGVAGQGPLTMVDCTVANNMAGDGGGVHLMGGPSIIEGTLFEGNSAGGDGGGLWDGGGATIRHSTFRDNAAGTSSSVGDGGALRTTASVVESSVFYGNQTADDGGAIRTSGNGFVLRRSTISGNQADDRGGGLYLGGSASLSSVTITDNDADPDGSSGADGGGIYVLTGTVEVRNSIVAGNRDATPVAAVRAADCAGTIVNDGFLHLGTTGIVFLDPACIVTGLVPEVGGDPGLGPLADNGGATLTHALLSGSPNLDGGDPFGCEDEDGRPLARDQRGAERIGVCDRGAFELGGEPPIFADGFENGGWWAWSAITP